MERLKKEDKDKISQILHNNWDLIFKLLTGSSNDEEGNSYREVYKWELSDREKELPKTINIYLENDAFFNRCSLRSWIIEEIIGAILVYSDCRKLQFFQCINQLYDLLLPVIRPYYVGLYSEETEI